MPTTPILGLPQVAPNQSQKEVTINDAIVALESATNGTLEVSFASGTEVTLSVEQFTRKFIFKATGAVGPSTLKVPAEINGSPSSRLFVVRNDSGFGLSVESETFGGGVIVIPNGASRLLDIDDNDVIIAAEPGTAVTFLDLTDTPDAYTGFEGNLIRVKADGSGLEYGTIGTLGDLADVDLSAPPTNGQTLVYVESSGKWSAATPAGSGSGTFTGLTDVPDSYTGQAGKGFRVKATEDGVEFYTPEQPSFVEFLPAQYWRLRFLTAEETQVAVGELEWLDVDGINLATGGTASASSTFSGSSPSNAFDSAPNVGWLSEAGSVAGVTLSYDFGVAVTIQSLRLTALSSFENYAPTSFVVERSDDGVTWIDAGTRSIGEAPEDFWTSQPVKTFTVNGSPVQGIPPGGIADQVLTKTSPNDGAFEWRDPQGISDAPSDGSLYARKDGAWESFSGASGSLYRFGGFFTTTPLAGETLMLHAVTDAFGFAADLAGSRVVVGLNPATTAIFSLKKNGTEIGTISIDTAGVASFDTGGVAITVAAGDTIALTAPAAADGSISNVAFTFKGTQS